ncbi:MAG: hypothetical protein IT374_24820 [Polyangiaceae bacterium]|nr:hypothetical protein [Polyangiaceae bacterium]
MILPEREIEAVLRALYDRMFDDPIVGFFFVGKDRDHIVMAQVPLVRRMLGERGVSYDGKPIPEAHAELPILPGHFDRRHFLLAEVLRERGVPDEVRARWLEVDRGFRDAVLKLGDERARALNSGDP